MLLDAVIRLYDQNRRGPMELPTEHPRVEELMESGHLGHPVRCVRRAGSSWSQSSLGADQPIIDVPGAVRGHRRELAKNEPHRVESAARTITSLVPVRGAIRCTVAGTVFDLSVGTILPLPPDWVAELHSSTGATVAVHSVPVDAVFTKWG